jgi:hypothetical protein
MKDLTAPHLRRRNPVRAALPVVLFLVGFAAVLVAVCRLYLLPALRAAASADPQQRRQLGATAWLVMAVVLFVLFAGLLLTFRVGRFFFPRPAPPARGRTEYVDAWAESGRRMTAGESHQEDAGEEGDAAEEGDGGAG